MASESEYYYFSRSYPLRGMWSMSSWKSQVWKVSLRNSPCNTKIFQSPQYKLFTPLILELRTVTFAYIFVNRSLPKVFFLAKTPNLFLFWKLLIREHIHNRATVLWTSFVCHLFSLKTQSACHVCGENDHKRRDCPQRKG